jgi:hypothetical protein
MIKLQAYGHITGEGLRSYSRSKSQDRFRSRSKNIFQSIPCGSQYISKSNTNITF